MFLASMATAFLRDTRRAVQFIEDDEIVAVTPEGATFSTPTATIVDRPVEEIDWDEEAAEKSGFETFMLKEIYEQPDAIEETIGDRIRHGRLGSTGLGLTDEEIREPAAHRHRRLRHRIPLGRRRPLCDRGMGAHPGGARHRERMALPESRPVEGHARDRDHAVG